MDYVLPNGLNIVVEWTGSFMRSDSTYARSKYWVEEFTITHVGGRKCSRKVDVWLQSRMTVNQIEDLQNAISEYME